MTDNSPASKALRKAAKAGSVEETRKAIDAGALIDSADQRGWTALHLACRGNHLDVVKLLCEFGSANVNAQTAELSTPLVVCAYNGRLDICRYLVEDRGADFTLVDHVGDTPLQIAQQRKRQLVVDLLTQDKKRPRRDNDD